MKPRNLIYLFSSLFLIPTPASAIPILFPDGNFEQGTLQMILSPVLGGTSTGTASNWSVEVGGLIGLGTSAGTVDDGDSNVAQLNLGLGLGGTASMIREVVGEFEPDSDYVVSLNLRSDSLLNLDLAGLIVEVVDGNGNVVASWADDTLLNLLDPLLTEFQTIELPFSTTGTAPDGPLSLRIGANSISLLGYTIEVDDIGVDIEPTDDGSGGGGSGGGGSGGGGSGSGSGGGSSASNSGSHGPSIAVRGKSRFSTTKDRVLIRGRASDDFRVINVQYQLRGKSRSRAVRVASGTNSWKFRFPLKPGKNVVRVRALDNDGTMSRWKRIVITRLSGED